MPRVKKPNRWIAGLIALFAAPPLALMYAARPRAAWLYLTVLVAVAVVYLWMGAPSDVALLFPLIVMVGAIHAFLAASRYPQDRVRPGYSRWYGLLGTYLVFFVVLLLVRAFLFEPFHMKSNSMLPNVEGGRQIVVSKWGYGLNSSYGITLRKGAVSATINRGDVLVFVYPESNGRIDYLMRVVGLPGDRVEYTDKSLTINGRPAVYQNDGRFQYAAHDARLVSTTVRREKLGGVAYRVLTMPGRPGIFVGQVRDFPGKAACTYGADSFTCRVPEKHYFMLGDNRDASNDSRYWGFVPQDHIVGKVVNLRP